MKNRIFAASYQRAVELMAGGCALDYLDALRPHSAARRKPFHAKQLAGYAESRVYELGPFLNGFVIGLCLWTDRPAGTVIADWSFVPPWQDHLVCWDYGPLDVIPEGERGVYRPVLDSRLMGVLKERRLLKRGFPI